MHLDGLIIPLLRRFSHVKILPFNRIQLNNVIFGHVPWFHSLTHLFFISRSFAPLTRPVASLRVNVPTGRQPHCNISRSRHLPIFLCWSYWAIWTSSSPWPLAENQASDFHCLIKLSPSVSSHNSYTLRMPSLSNLSCSHKWHPSGCHLHRLHLSLWKPPTLPPYTSLLSPRG